jgi:RimJ/RimL family protein N-acetyltransferase
VRRIRNLPTNRQWFVNTGEVGRFEHLRWWAGSHRRAEWLYVVEHDGRRAGYVRVHLVAAGTLEVGIALDPSFQGMGVGRKALSMAVQETAAQLPPDMRWEARVRVDNQASIKMFLAVGFVIELESAGSHIQFLTMTLTRA